MDQSNENNSTRHRGIRPVWCRILEEVRQVEVETRVERSRVEEDGVRSQDEFTIVLMKESIVF
jgi:hypothetical protein